MYIDTNFFVALNKREIQHLPQKLQEFYARCEEYMPDDYSLTFSTITEYLGEEDVFIDLCITCDKDGEWDGCEVTTLSELNLTNEETGQLFNYIFIGRKTA